MRKGGREGGTEEAKERGREGGKGVPLVSVRTRTDQSAKPLMTK